MEANSSLARAQRLSRWLARAFAFVCYAAPVALLLLGAAFVTFYDLAFADLKGQTLGAEMPPHLDVTRRWLLVATAGLHAAPLVVAAAHLRRLFESFAAKVIFTGECFAPAGDRAMVAGRRRCRECLPIPLPDDLA